MRPGNNSFSKRVKKKNVLRFYFCPHISRVFKSCRSCGVCWEPNNMGFDYKSGISLELSGYTIENTEMEFDYYQAECFLFSRERWTDKIRIKSFVWYKYCNINSLDKHQLHSRQHTRRYYFISSLFFICAARAYTIPMRLCVCFSVYSLTVPT